MSYFYNEICKKHSVHCCCGWLTVVQPLLLIVTVCERKQLGFRYFIRDSFRDFASRVLLYKYDQPYLQVISLLHGHFLCWLPPELCNKYSFHCNQIFDFNSLFSSDDTAFSTTEVLGPLVAKLVEPSTTFSKLNLMTSTVTSVKEVEE